MASKRSAGRTRSSVLRETTISEGEPFGKLGKDENEGEREQYNILFFLTAYNEEQTIGPVLDSLLEVAKDIRNNLNHNVDILVVDDCSADKTIQVARKRSVFITPHSRNLGPGAATQTGYKFAVRNGYDVTVRLDADGQHPPEEIPQLLHPVLTDQVDIVVGSRFKSDKSYEPTLLRKIGIRFYSAFVSYLTGEEFTDLTSGFRAAKIDVGKEHADDYPNGIVAIDRGIREVLKGYRIKEVPVEMNQRDYGTSYLDIRRLVKYPLISVFSLINALWREDRRE